MRLQRGWKQEAADPGALCKYCAKEGGEGIGRDLGAQIVLSGTMGLTLHCYYMLQNTEVR